MVRVPGFRWIPTVPTTFQTMARFLVTVVLVSAISVVASNEEAISSDGPVFIREPPSSVDFSSISGAVVDCSARASPKAVITWLQADGSTVATIDRLRRVAANGSLVFMSFQSEDYRPDVHAMVYRCVATNPIGSIVSRDVQVKAVVPHPPDIQVYDVYAIVGNTAVMRCHVPPIMADYVHVTSWIRDGKFTVNSTTLDGKYLLMPEGELHIQDVQMAETSSSYQCKAANRLTGEVYLSNTPGKLLVTVPEGSVPPDIMNSRTSVVTREGAFAVIPCATQGYPVPTITWYGKVAEGQEHPLLMGDRLQKTPSALIIKKLQVSDSNVYVCDVSNDVGSKRVETAMTVTAKLGTVIEPHVLTVDLAAQAVFRCTITGHPVSSVNWLHNGKAVKDFVQNMGATSVLRLESVKVNYRGMYQCVVSNSQETVQATAELRLQDEPPEFHQVFEEKVLGDGQGMSLRCVAFGVPPPQVTWAIDGNVVRRPRIAKVDESTDSHGNVVSTLRIQNPTLKDAGLYQCTAANKAGKVTHGARINLHGQPFGRNVPKQVAIAASTVYINCPVYGHPIEVFQWEKDSRILPLNLRQAVYPNGTLVIEKVKKTTDAGRYTCSAWNKEGQKAQVAVQLEVLVVPKIVPFAFQEGRLAEGAFARVSCVVYQGDLPIGLEWLKDGRPVPPTVDVKIRAIDDYSSILTIEKVARTHSGNYTCVARNEASEASHTAVLVVNVPPKIVPFSFQDKNMLEGMLARVSCVVSRGDLPLLLRWEKDGNPLETDAKSLSVTKFDEFSSILSIDSVRTEHSGIYSCVAANDAGEARASAQLIVDVPPRWIVEPKDTSVALGNDVLLNCQAEGSPPPTITWMKADGVQPGDRKVIVTTNYHYHVYTNGSLLLKNSQHDDEGYYYCQASNGVDEGLSLATHLLVDIPPLINDENVTAAARIGENVTLSCDVTGDEPLSVTWKKNGLKLPVEKDKRLLIQHVQSGKYKSHQLHIMGLQRQDTAIYSCSAKNNFGEAKAVRSLTVHEHPDRPTGLRAAKIESRNVDVTWKRPFDGYVPILNYVIEYFPKFQKDRAEFDARNISVMPDMTSAVLTGLVPATEYHVQVFARNEIGTSNPSEKLAFKTDEEAPAGPPQSVKVESIDTQTVNITWKPPNKDFQNGVLKGYYVYHKIYGSNDQFAPKTIQIPEDPKIEEIYTLIKGVKKFTTYEVIVEAFNEKGRGPPSAPVLVATSEGVPSSPPQDVRCTAVSSQRIQVTWIPPPPMTVNGILQGYHVLYKPVDQWYETSQPRNSSTKTARINLENLKKYGNYSVRVSAFTKAGGGAVSGEIFCRTLEDVPDPPADVKAFPTSETCIMIAWRKPLHTNGEIKQYTVYVRSVDSGPKDLFQDIAKSPAGAHENEYEVCRLRKERRYEFWVTASTQVGEGNPTKVVTESPSGTFSVEARLASFDEKIVVTWRTNVTLPCKSVGVPTPEREWTLRDAPVHTMGRVKVLADGTLVIRDIQGEDAGSYVCQVRNNKLGMDKVTYEVHVHEPPHPPEISVTSTTLSNIELKLTPGKTGGLRIEGYILKYRQASGLWKEVNISAEAVMYKLTNLSCGTPHEMQICAYNRLGVGEYSEILRSSTDGAAPTAPERDKLIEVSTKQIAINLGSWISNGCHIQYYTIKYRAKGGRETWQPTYKNIPPDSEKRYVIEDLQPATWYTLKMSAHNSAGTTAMEYEFATLTSSGSTIPPEVVADQGVVEPSGLLSEWERWLIVSVASSVMLLLAFILTVCLCVKRKKRQNRRKRGIAQIAQNNKRTDSKKNSNGLSYLKGNLKNHHAEKNGFLGKKRKESNDRLTPYATSPLSNQELRAFQNQPTTSWNPTNNVESNDVGKLNGGLNATRFARPKSYQSGFRTPTHDPSSKGLRVAHPVPIPTAPPLSDAGSCTYTLRGGTTFGDKSVTPIKSAHSIGGNVGDRVTSETTFIFPRLMTDETGNPMVLNGTEHAENNYENLPTTTGFAANRPPITALHAARTSSYHP